MAIKIILQRNFCQIDLHQKQRCVIEFLNVEKVQPINIHKHLVNVYSSKTVHVSMVRRWVCCFQSGDRDVSNKPCSGHPSTATNKENEAHLDELFKSNQLITVKNEHRVESEHGYGGKINILFGVQQKVCQMGTINAHSGAKRPLGCWNDMKLKAMPFLTKSSLVMKLGVTTTN